MHGINNIKSAMGYLMFQIRMSGSRRRWMIVAYLKRCSGIRLKNTEVKEIYHYGQATGRPKNNRVFSEYKYKAKDKLASAVMFPSPGSHLGRKTDYPDKGITWLSSVSPCYYRNSTLTQAATPSHITSGSLFTIIPSFGIIRTLQYEQPAAPLNYN
jgi:hypothetical protein